MKKTFILVMALIAFISTSYAVTESTKTHTTQSQQSKQDQNNDNNPSLYDSIKTGWNKFLDFLGAKKTSD